MALAFAGETDCICRSLDSVAVGLRHVLPAPHHMVLSCALPRGSTVAREIVSALIVLTVQHVSATLVDRECFAQQPTLPQEPPQTLLCQGEVAVLSVSASPSASVPTVGSVNLISNGRQAGTSAAHRIDQFYPVAYCVWLGNYCHSLLADPSTPPQHPTAVMSKAVNQLHRQPLQPRLCG